MLTVGIDGGGTSTRVELRDSVHPARRMRFGAFNIASIGAEAFRGRVREVFSACGGAADMAAVCVGGAGASSSAMADILREELRLAGFHGKLRLCTDFEIALRGAMDGPGAILIAGTGSVAYGEDASGRGVRVGGWGHLIDDAGSGYALGRDALSAAVMDADGRLHAPALRQAIYDALHVTDVAGVLNDVYYSGHDKSGIAAMARPLLDCAEAGDEPSLCILRRGADALRCLVEALTRRLALPDCRLALLGGLMESDNVYRRIVEARLADCVRLIPPAHDALWGAAQLAQEMAE